MRALLVLVFLLLAAKPADAHRLKVFATVEDGTVGGYGFFIGGGRPEQATIIVQDGVGTELYRGKTDDAGAFAWRPEHGGDFVIIIDAGDGHVAQTKIPATRFADGGVATAEAGPAADGAASAAGGPGETATVPAEAAVPDDLVRTIDRSVDRAVARQMRPLLEAYEAAEGATRFNDVVGGIGMIVGLAGMAMWGLAWRRDREARPKGPAR